MKMRRRTGVNGVRENHRDTVVNQGGTARVFRSLIGKEGSAFFTKKYRAGYFPEETKTEKKEEENIMAKEKKLVESITAREVDFAQWYTDVVREAKLCDYSGVKDV
mgnify:CR=1 FL=1